MSKRMTVTITQEDAIERGSIEYGATPVSDFEAVLRELLREERRYLAVAVDSALVVRDPSEMGGMSEHVCARSGGTADVVAGVRKAIVTLEQRQREELEKWRGRVQGLLDDPRQFYHEHTLRPQWYWNKTLAELVTLTGGAFDLATVERVQSEAYEQIKAEWEQKCLVQLRDCRNYELTSRRETAEEHQLTSLVQAIDEEINRRYIEQGKKEEQGEAEAQQVWVSWAREYGSPELKYAIEQNYKCQDAVNSEVVSSVVEGLGLVGIVRDAVGEGEVSVPSKKAIDLRNKLVAAVNGLNKPLPTNIKYTVSRIQHCRWFEECSCGGDDECEDHDDDGEQRHTGECVVLAIESLHHKEDVYFCVV